MYAMVWILCVCGYVVRTVASHHMHHFWQVIHPKLSSWHINWNLLVHVKSKHMHVIGKLAERRQHKWLDGWIGRYMDGWIRIHPSTKLPCKGWGGVGGGWGTTFHLLQIFNVDESWVMTWWVGWSQHFAKTAKKNPLKNKNQKIMGA
jgi:hypothetical protein